MVRVKGIKGYWIWPPIHTQELMFHSSNLHQLTYHRSFWKVSVNVSCQFNARSLSSNKPKTRISSFPLSLNAAQKITIFKFPASHTMKLCYDNKSFVLWKSQCRGLHLSFLSCPLNLLIRDSQGYMSLVEMFLTRMNFTNKILTTAKLFSSDLLGFQAPKKHLTGWVWNSRNLRTILLSFYNIYDIFNEQISYLGSFSITFQIPLWIRTRDIFLDTPPYLKLFPGFIRVSWIPKWRPRRRYPLV